MRKIGSAVMVIFWIASSAGAALPAALGDFEAYVGQVRKEFEVPGVAVAIVKDGEVVLARGFGVKKMGESAAVDVHTRFSIASNTKAFTAAALAILMDEGKLKWGDRVIDHLPWFQMADAYVTREMTLRDLLVHRSGLALGAGDLLYWQQATFIVRWRDRSLNADAWVTFALTPDAVVEQVKMAAVSPLTDFSFDFHHLVLKPVGR